MAERDCAFIGAVTRKHRVVDDKKGGRAEAALGSVQPLINRGTGNQFGGVPVGQAVFLAEIAQDGVRFMDGDVIVYKGRDLMVRVHKAIVGRHMFASVERNMTGLVWNAGFFQQGENPAAMLRYRMSVKDGHIKVSNRVSGLKQVSVYQRAAATLLSGVCRCRYICDPIDPGDPARYGAAEIY